jgi:hypothetical protein
MYMTQNTNVAFKTVIYTYETVISMRSSEQSWRTGWNLRNCNIGEKFWTIQTYSLKLTKLQYLWEVLNNPDVQAETYETAISVRSSEQSWRTGWNLLNCNIGEKFWTILTYWLKLGQANIFHSVWRWKTLLRQSSKSSAIYFLELTRRHVYCLLLLLLLLLLLFI